MQSLKWRIGSKIRLKWTVPWFLVFVDQNLKIIWKFSLSQDRCHKTPIDVENCVKSALNTNHRKQNFTVITNWGGEDYQLRSALAAKQIWVAVITIWGTLDSLPPQTLPKITQFKKHNRARSLYRKWSCSSRTSSIRNIPPIMTYCNIGPTPTINFCIIWGLGLVMTISGPSTSGTGLGPCAAATSPSNRCKTTG